MKVNNINYNHSDAIFGFLILNDKYKVCLFQIPGISDTYDIGHKIKLFHTVKILL